MDPIRIQSHSLPPANKKTMRRDEMKVMKVIRERETERKGQREREGKKKERRERERERHSQATKIEAIASLVIPR